MATGTLSSNGTLHDTLTLTTRSGSITLNTANKYVSKNIQLNYNIPGVRIPTAISSSNNNTFYVEVPNGNSNDYIRFTFSVDSNGNTIIT